MGSSGKDPWIRPVSRSNGLPPRSVTASKYRLVSKRSINNGSWPSIGCSHSTGRKKVPRANRRRLPVPRDPEEERVSARVREYLDGAITSGDGRPLAVRAIARYVPCSPTTIYKYGLEKAIVKTARDLKKGSHHSARSATVADYETRLAAAKQEAVEWERKYRDLLNKLVLIEYHLRGHPAVNLDVIYATPPDRSEPYRPSSRRRSHHRRD
jgi:hypothetical protein